MKKKPATAAEKKYMGRVAALGCVICEMPAQVHHCGTYMGGGRDHYAIIPLCDKHHSASGQYGIALHAGKKKWEKTHGSEAYWILRVQDMLNK